MERLNLADALASDRLDDFAKQAEADGIGPAHRVEFDALIKALPPEDQTSRSPDCDGSREK